MVSPRVGGLFRLLEHDVLAAFQLQVITHRQARLPAANHDRVNLALHFRPPNLVVHAIGAAGQQRAMSVLGGVGQFLALSASWVTKRSASALSFNFALY